MRTFHFLLTAFASGCWPRSSQVFPTNQCLQMSNLMKSVIITEQQEKPNEDSTEILYSDEALAKRAWWRAKQPSPLHPILYQYALHVAISTISETPLIVPATGYRISSSEKAAFLVTAESGETLFQYIQTYRSEMPEYNVHADLQYLEEVVEIGYRTFEILEKLHALGVVHGDINVESFRRSQRSTWVLTNLHRSYLTSYPPPNNKKARILATFKDDMLNLMKVFAYMFCGQVIDNFFENEWYLVNGDKCFDRYMIPVDITAFISLELTHMLTNVRSVDQDYSLLRNSFKHISHILYVAENSFDDSDSIA